MPVAHEAAPAVTGADAVSDLRCSCEEHHLFVVTPEVRRSGGTANAPYLQCPAWEHTLNRAGAQLCPLQDECKTAYLPGE